VVFTWRIVEDILAFTYVKKRSSNVVNTFSAQVVVIATFCTFDPSPKVHFTLHVLCSKFWSWLMVGWVWKWVREGCIEWICFIPIAEKDCFSVLAIITEVWAYLFVEAMIFIQNYSLQIKDANCCSRDCLESFCMLLECTFLVTHFWFWKFC